MKKVFCTVLTICMLLSLPACGVKPQEDTVTEFKPALDTGTSCSITVAGNYDNFEALEAEFDRFNEYYPNVQLSYVKLDDYNNTLGTALGGNDRPNIFFSYTWMNGDEKYASVLAHMEDLSDAALKLDLGCIRPGLIHRDSEGHVLMVPVFMYCALVLPSYADQVLLSVETMSDTSSPRVRVPPMPYPP